MKYSVDKIKLFYYGVSSELLQEIMDSLSLDPCVASNYESKKTSNCRYNYVLEGNGNLYLGIEPNWIFRQEDKKTKHIVIEYNPNKVLISDFKCIKALITYPVRKIEIMSMDIAVDIYTHKVNELLVYKRHGNEYWARLGHGTTETIYLGTFGESGHIKIYNKAKEQKLSDDMIWTRFEITYKKLGFMDIKDTDIIENTKLPKILINESSQMSFNDLKGTDKYIFLTSLDNMDLLELLDRRMRKKIQEYHEMFLNSIQIEKSEIIKVYKEFKII